MHETDATMIVSRRDSSRFDVAAWRDDIDVVVPRRVFLDVEIGLGRRSLGLVV